MRSQVKVDGLTTAQATILRVMAKHDVVLHYVAHHWLFKERESLLSAPRAARERRLQDKSVRALIAGGWIENITHAKIERERDGQVYWLTKKARRCVDLQHESEAV